MEHKNIRIWDVFHLIYISIKSRCFKILVEKSAKISIIPKENKRLLISGSYKTENIDTNGCILLKK